MRPTSRRRLSATAVPVAALIAFLAAVAASTPASSTEPTEGADGASRAAAPTVTIRPGALSRGASPQVPWVFDRTLYDGVVRAEVPRDAWLLGASDEDYLLLRMGSEVNRVLRVSPDGTRTPVLEVPTRRQVSLASDGAMLLSVVQRRVDGDWHTIVRTHDPMTGDAVDRRRFSGIVDVLDADVRQVVLGSWTPRPRTLVWDVQQDTTELLLRQVGYVAGLRADLVGTFTKDPYLGGCAVLRRLSNPTEVLSRSCTERVAAISPSGRRVATIHILSDGLGPREVSVRRDTGRKLVDYRVAEWFGRVDFESDSMLLLEASGRTRQAVVRCEATSCERATRTRPTPTY